CDRGRQAFGAVALEPLQASDDHYRVDRQARDHARCFQAPVYLFGEPDGRGLRFRHLSSFCYRSELRSRRPRMASKVRLLPPNTYEADPALKALLASWLRSETLEWAEPQLREAGRAAAAELHDWGAQCEARPASLRSID